ncbi:MAG: diguanylate cyclase [Piscirickettsiaceae bacterium]|nr:diguanylate cyclase [Piscirickettsiaceae bacterium]
MSKIGQKLDSTFLIHLQGALDFSPACIVIAKAPNGEVTYINEAVIKFWGKIGFSLTDIEIEEYIKTWKEYSADGHLLSEHELPLIRAIQFGEIVESEEIIVELDDGTRKWALASASPIYDDEGNIIAGSVIWCDITKQKELEMKLDQKASYDFLTGILSRQKIFELAGRAFTRSQLDNSPITFLMLDIDHFKSVNDNYGHIIGDEVLQVFADIIQSNIRPSDTFGRIGGEEFLVFFQNTSFDLGILLAETLRHKIENHPIITKAGTINITTSIGIFSTSDKDEKFDTLEDVLSKIDCGLYNAKREGRNCIGKM